MVTSKVSTKSLVSPPCLAVGVTALADHLSFIVGWMDG